MNRKMFEMVIIAIFILIIAVLMTSVGKGGGNFYLLVLVFAAVPVYEASTTGQLILLTASLMGMFVFHKNKTVNWQLAIPVGLLVAASAFAGGFLSFLFSEIMLKSLFTILLILAGIVMVIPYSPRKFEVTEKRFGYIKIHSEESEIILNLKIVVPVTLFTGFFSGMIGVSGGSFLVPMLVLACSLPMKTSVTTATPLISISAAMGFLGHTAQGHFNPYLALPLVAVAVIGGILGGKLALRSRPTHLKLLFAISNWAAALIMMVNLLITAGWI